MTSFLFYRRPNSPAWTISGSGAQFESDVRLSDGNPGVLTTFRWLQASEHEAGDFVALRSDWASPIQVRGGALQGLSVEGGAFPAGVKLEVRGKRVGDSGYPYALGGNALTQVSRELDDGSIGAAWLFDAGLTPLVGIEIRILNDTGGSPWADSDTYVRVGEADPFEGVPVRIAYGWRTQQELQVEVRRTLGAQLHEAERTNWRALEFALAPAAGYQVRREGLVTGADWQRIEALLGRAGARAMVFVRTQDEVGAFDADELHSTMIFGRARPQAIVHVSRDYYGGGWRIEQIPPIV